MSDRAEDELRAAILRLLDERDPSSSICPSDAARAVAPEGWHDLMPTTRSAAAALVTDGVVEVTQGGQVVDVTTARGPVRIRKAC